MKAKGIYKIYAGLVVMLFLSIAVMMNVVAMRQPTKVSAVAGTDGEDEITEEEFTFPASLPVDDSSLTKIIACRRYSARQDTFYDVGYSVYVMRLTDGEQHSWTMTGTLTILWSKEGMVDIQQLSGSATWQDMTLTGYDIVKHDRNILTNNFYKVIINMHITKDMGQQQDITKTLYGYKYYVNGISYE